MHDRWTDSVEPGSLIFGTGSSEGRSGQLFGIQAVGTFLRGVLILWQCVGVIGVLRREVGAKATQILKG